MSVAKVISQRSPCLKRQIGAIIVREDVILATGYNGPARGEPHCIVCNRIGLKHGSAYDESCPAVHAEENAIVNAAREGVSIKGGTIYIYGKDGAKPCYRCKRLIINSGIKDVVT